MKESDMQAGASDLFPAAQAPVDRGRRRMLIAGASAGLFATGSARGFSLADLTQHDAAAGVKVALEKGAQAAVSLLGRTDGFWGNERVRIPLPDALRRAESVLKFIGRGRDVDDLKLGVNRAAEQAVPEAMALLVDAVRHMTLEDAKGIVKGGDDSATRFFADKTREPLSERFLPIVTQVTDRIGLARRYNSLAQRGQRLGLVQGDQTRIERYVTGKALDGLYLMIGEEEKKIRRDPVGTGSDILKKVFGAIR